MYIPQDQRENGVRIPHKPSSLVRLHLYAPPPLFLTPLVHRTQKSHSITSDHHHLNHRVLSLSDSHSISFISLSLSPPTSLSFLPHPPANGTVFSVRSKDRTQLKTLGLSSSITEFSRTPPHRRSRPLDPFIFPLTENHLTPQH